MELFFCHLIVVNCIEWRAVQIGDSVWHHSSDAVSIVAVPLGECLLYNASPEAKVVVSAFADEGEIVALHWKVVVNPHGVWHAKDVHVDSIDTGCGLRSVDEVVVNSFYILSEGTDG